METFSSLAFLYDAAQKSQTASEEGKGASGEEGNRKKDTVKECKEMILEILDFILQEEYWRPLTDPSTPLQTVQETIGEVSGWMMAVMDSTQVDGRVEALREAPLILDYEVCYQMSDSIKAAISLVSSRWGDEVECDRLELLLLSLDNLVTFSGNRQLQLDKREQRQAASRQAAFPLAAAPPQSSASPPPPYSSAMAATGPGEEAIPEAELHDLIASISQVQDLFPDLGEGFIEVSLDWIRFSHLTHL